MTIPIADGWLADLYLDPIAALESDPTIADVHTQPADEVGTIVGRVLHVATGYPRLMVVTADTCSPRAYAGVSFAYHETITEGFDRRTDERWAAQLNSSSPPDVTWLAPVLAE